MTLITGTIKNKVDSIWNDMAAGGITDPLTVIKQITYLMFIRSLDEKELEAERFENATGEHTDKIFPQTQTGQEMRWSLFKNKNTDKILEIVSQRVFPAIKKIRNGRLPDFDADGKLIEITDDIHGNEETTAFARYMEDATFDIADPQLIDKVIKGLDSLFDEDVKDLDMQGDLYEYMLDKLSTAGRNGQFRTPKQIRDMMVELIAPTPDDCFCDPACGTAGFLISAAEYLRRNYENTMTEEQWDKFDGEMFSGNDTDKTMLQISAMNLLLHSINKPALGRQSSISKQYETKGKYTVCLANPPFTGSIDASQTSDDLLAVTNTKKTELLFVALFLRILQKGGRCACIVPDGVLFGASNAHKALRKELVENHNLRAVISMPSGVFKPYAGVSTAVLVFTKTGEQGSTEKVWFYDMKADGKSLDDKRQPVEENDIPDIIARFKNLDGETTRTRYDRSFFVTAKEIAENDYDLSINKYKKVEYTPVEYPPTEQLIAEIEELNSQIAAGLEELKRIM